MREIIIAKKLKISANNCYKEILLFSDINRGLQMNALKNSALKNASPVILLLISLIFPCYPPVIFPVILLLFWNAENIVKIKNSILKNENKINVLRSFVPQDDKVNHGEMVMLNLFQHRTNSESIILKSSAFVWDAETSSA